MYIDEYKNDLEHENKLATVFIFVTKILVVYGNE